MVPERHRERGRVRAEKQGFHVLVLERRNKEVDSPIFGSLGYTLTNLGSGPLPLRKWCLLALGCDG